MAKPSIVFLPGAWHTAECFDALTPYLKEVGYDTYPLTLPSVSEPDPIRSLDPEIEHVHKTIIPLIEDGQDVIIVCHSYGGVPGSSSVKGLSKKDRAAQGKLGGVSAMVYICSWMIEEGQTIRGCGGGKGGKLGPAKLHIEVRSPLRSPNTELTVSRTNNPFTSIPSRRCTTISRLMSASAMPNYYDLSA